MTKLTLKTIPKLPVTGGDAVFWDDDVTRFGLRITAKGARSYFIKYRNAQGRSRYLTIGRHDPWTPDQARKRAEELLKQADAGLDPAEAKQEAKTAITISQLCDEYVKAAENGLVIARGKTKKASTLFQDKSRISAHIKPLLGDKPVRELTRDQVKHFYNAVVMGKTARVAPTGKKRGKSIVEGGPTAAKRCVGLLGGMMTYAMELGYRPDGVNPARNISMRADERREFRLDKDGWQALGAVLETAEEKGECWQAVTIAKLLALTGCRKEEIGSLKWSEIDFENRCFRFANAADGRKRVKSGEIRPIGQAALQILKGLRDASKPGKRASAFVFPGVLQNADKPYQGLKGAFKRMGIPSPHNLRHAVASATEVDCKFHESTVAALLGHK
ncbi:MAG: integrase arm-type DNA-binding domain-containing protein [Rhodomicrobium sp.]